MSPSPFGLKVMPGWRASRCFIDMLPTEILCMIFDYFSLLTPSSRGQIPPIILLSHISRHWRRVALSASCLWDRLDIYNVRHPEVLRDFLSRSQQRSLTIRIHMPQTIFYSGDDIPEFDDICGALVEQLKRIRSVSITARNQTLRRLTDKVLVNVPLPHLQHLELVSLNDQAMINLGPFNFDPRVFTSLRVERAAIQVKDGRHLSGLQMFVLCAAPLTYLDQRKVPSATYPAAPMNWYTDLPAPSFRRLTNLQIHAPYLHPIPGRPQPVVFNAHGVQVPLPPFAPSFRADRLRSVTLSSLSHSTMPFQAEVGADVLGRLFRIICKADLTELHLIDMKDQAIDGFLLALSSYHSRFPSLRVLRLTAVHVLHIVNYGKHIGLESFRTLFANAFPSLSEVYLAMLDPSPLVEILGKVTLWPMLKKLEYEGQILSFGVSS